jgi:hypothetical protein
MVARWSPAGNAAIRSSSRKKRRADGDAAALKIVDRLRNLLIDNLLW